MQVPAMNAFARYTLLGLTLCLATASTGLAAKGGNGGGKPGGGDPPPTPSLPVTYTITAPTMPDSYFYFNDHNESGAAVGWNLGGGGPDAARPVVYLPDVDANQAFYLDQLPSFPGMPSGYSTWHPRSAVAINNLGDIGGNAEPINNVNNTSQASLYLRSSGTPQMMVLDLQDPDADREWVAAINDSGDTLIGSRKTVNDVTVESLFVGNIYDDPTAFEKIDMSTFGPYSGGRFGDYLFLGDRVGGGPAMLATRLLNDTTGDLDVVRMAIDGSSFEAFEPYVGQDGTYYNGFFVDAIHDINDAGDVSGPGVASSKPNSKGKVGSFAAIWGADTSELESLGNPDALASTYFTGYLNNSGDYIIDDGWYYPGDLWHSEFGPDNGLIPVTDLFDPADLGSISFTRAFELTDQGATGWPTIIARGSEVIGEVEYTRLLILTPELVSSALLAGTAVPEPSTTALALLAMVLPGVWRMRGWHLS